MEFEGESNVGMPGICKHSDWIADVAEKGVRTLQLNRQLRGPLAKAPASSMVARIADAVTGPTLGMVINRLAVSSALTDAAISLSIAPIVSSSASNGRQADEATRGRSRN
jgi:hypothetical protein